ncbi:TIGR03086 family metal-binding protein [Streptomyces sp. NBC_01198]|uniref:TIGR03086 family metal-binding protein n=1 Tax=Streptomyces sp. NBC_01198 TaxID=2903769 RepID=UPI002E14B3C4|nr:TIGR03086 family metal-binding protein [Streptomyces sp. NBC_01198]
MPTDLERIRALDARAVRLSAGLVRQTTVADLRRETPCAGWDLADLLAHMTAQHRGFAAAARGHGGDLALWAAAPAADPVGAHEAAAGDVLAAFAEVREEERPFVLPEFSAVRDFAAARAIGFHFLDYVVHAWDVAAALGVPFTPEADLLDAALPLALAVPPGSAAFAPELPAPPGGDTLSRILTRLGRQAAPD